MIPIQLLPGFGTWGSGLDSLLSRSEPLWIFGETGCGASTLAADLAKQRGAGLLEDGERLPTAELSAWIQAHPKGVISAHAADPTSACLALRLPSLAEAPESLPAILKAMASEEGIESVIPASLRRLPCPGNLRGLRNRLLRWKLLGQEPEPENHSQGPLSLEAEDLATNLHALEAFLLHRALQRSYGNRVEAAKRLGVSRRQLYLLIARHGDPIRGEASQGVEPKRLAKRNKAT